MSWITVATAVYGAYNAYEGNKKAKDAAKQAGNVTPVDPAEAARLAAQQSKDNAALSNQLEQQYNPYLNSLRQTSMSGLGGYMSMSPTDQALQGGYMNAFNQSANGPLAANPALTNAAASANQQLGLGGTLDQSMQNQIMRAGAARAGGLAGPGGGLGMGRDISARDLGLTSLQLLQQRQQQAAQIGGEASNYGLQALNQQQGAMLGYGGAASGLGQQQYLRNYNIANMTQGIQQPQAGLSPSSVAGIYTGNINEQNSVNQNQAAINAQLGQSQMSMGGQLMGYGLGGLSSYLGSGAGGGTPGLSNYFGTSGIGAKTTADQFFSPINTAPQIGYKAPTDW